MHFSTQHYSVEWKSACVSVLYIIELKNARWNSEIRKCPTSKTLQHLQKHQAKASENKYGYLVQ